MCLCSICGLLLLHMWWPSLDLLAAWDSRNPLADIRNCPLVRALAKMSGECVRTFLAKKPAALGERVRGNFYGGPAYGRPRGRSNNNPAAKCQTNVLTRPLCPFQSGHSALQFASLVCRGRLHKFDLD